MRKLFLVIFLIFSFIGTAESQAPIRSIESPQYSQTFTVTNTTATSGIDVRQLNINYWRMCFTIASGTPTFTVVLQKSDDNSSFSTLVSSGSVTATDCTAITEGNTNYIKLNPSAYSGASSSVLVTIGGWITNPDIGSIAGGSTTTPSYTRIQDGTSTPVATVFSPTGDAVVAATGTGLMVNSFLNGFNGTTYDRIRTANGASATTGTGLLGVGSMPFDGTNYRKLLTAWGAADTAVESTGVNAVGTLLIDTTVGAVGTNRSLKSASTIGDASTGYSFAGSLMMATNASLSYDRVKTANGASNTTGTGLLGTGLMGFDLTNWQKLTVASLGSSHYGLEIGASTSTADGVTQVSGPNSQSYGIGAFGWSFNATDWDRNRNIKGALSTGTGTLAVQEAPSVLGTVAVTAWTTGGLVNSPNLVAAGAHNLDLVDIINNSAVGSCYLQIFDAATAGAVTVGSTAPTLSFGVGSSGAAGIQAESKVVQFPHPVNFALGIVVAGTTTRAGGTSCGTGLDINLLYK